MQVKIATVNIRKALYLVILEELHPFYVIVEERARVLFISNFIHNPLKSDIICERE